MVSERIEAGKVVILRPSGAPPQPPGKTGLQTLAVTLLLCFLAIGVELMSNALAEWVVAERSVKVASLSPL